MIRDFQQYRPECHPTAYIAESADVIGRVQLGADSSIWFNTVVRGDGEQIVVGDGSNIQDCSACHADPGFPLVLGRGVTVGHRAILHGCRIEDDVLVGMGAIVMNGAVIGTGSIVGAGAVVSEGVHIPPNSLVLGLPGTVRRGTSDQERAAVVLNAEHYVELARSYRQA